MICWIAILAAILTVGAFLALLRRPPLFLTLDIGSEPSWRSWKSTACVPYRHGTRQLSEEERHGCLWAWRWLSKRFDSDPKMSVVYADLLVSDLIGHRGLDRQIEDQYQIAHQLMQQNIRGRATVDDLQRAMGLYGGLFKVLLAKPALSSRVAAPKEDL